MSGKSNSMTDTQVIKLMNGREIRAMNDLVYVRKCEKDHIRGEDGKIMLYRTEIDADTTNYAQILGCGPKCREVKSGYIGRFVVVEELAQGVHRLFDTEDFAVKEKVIMDANPYLIGD